MATITQGHTVYGAPSPSPRPYLPPPVAPPGVGGPVPIWTPPQVGGGTGVGSGQQANPGLAPGAGQGTPFIVGQTPGRKGGKVIGPQLPSPFKGLLGGLNTGLSYDEAAAALAAQEGKVDSIFNSPLGIESGQFGLLGDTLARLLKNPQGFNEDALRAARTRIAEREASLRTGGFERLTGASGRSGFGKDRLANRTLRESLRGQSGQRITDAEIALEMENAKLQQQSIQAAIQAALGVSSISAGLAGQHAGIAASSYNPLAVGGGYGEGGGGGYPGSGLLPSSFGSQENRLPGESLADQIRREAAARQAAYATPGLDLSGLGFTASNPAHAW